MGASIIYKIFSKAVLYLRRFSCSEDKRLSRKKFQNYHKNEVMSKFGTLQDYFIDDLSIMDVEDIRIVNNYDCLLRIF